MGRILIIKNVNFSNQAVDNVTPRPISVIDISGEIERTTTGYQFLHSPAGGYRNSIQHSSALSSSKAAVLDVEEYVGSTMIITWRTENKINEGDNVVYKRCFASSISTPISEVEISGTGKIDNYATVVQYINGTKASSEEFSYITESLAIPDGAKYLVFAENINYPTTVKVFV